MSGLRKGGRAEEGGACVCAFREAAGGLPIVGMRRSVGFFCFLVSFLFLPSSCATREMPSKVTLHCIHAAMRTENGSEEWGRRMGRGRRRGCGRGRREQRTENREQRFGNTLCDRVTTLPTYLAPGAPPRFCFF
ncbi:hypothetical protein LX32DRAFT_126988 [Colletotrichum zoysiae]|uniref:Uncharacterized protein n=1 Tax=Colletotrichum zoysiae TaxID=1216348 RepID=A0AAD9LZD3_9PEZI|nr:hypothetical protein LX32DRAFT_126988 [Colletotrichum zoysiae]